MLVSCVVLLALIFDTRGIDHIRFLESQLSRRMAFGALALLQILFGVGFIRRNKTIWAWYFVYQFLGTLFVAANAILYPRNFFGDQRPEWDLAMGAMVFGTAIGFGIYFATKPVFDKAATSGYRA